MSGADHRGFDWKAIAEVLRKPRLADGSLFWREIKKLDPKRTVPAMVAREQRNSAIHRFGKSGSRRSTVMSSSASLAFGSRLVHVSAASCAQRRSSV
jgi:hypothetical protein